MKILKNENYMKKIMKMLLLGGQLGFCLGQGGEMKILRNTRRKNRMKNIDSTHYTTTPLLLLGVQLGY